MATAPLRDESYGRLFPRRGGVPLSRSRRIFVVLRHGILLVAVAAAGFVAISIHNLIMSPVWFPLDAPLNVISGKAQPPAFKLSAGKPYLLYLSVKPVVPYADCLLGQTDAGCKHYASVIDLAWSIRDLKGRVLASGKSVGSCCSYVGNKKIDVMIDRFSIPSTTVATIDLHFKRDARALSSLSPRVAIEIDPGVAESESIREALIALLLAAVGLMGLTILAASIVSRIRSRQSA